MFVGILGCMPKSSLKSGGEMLVGIVLAVAGALMVLKNRDLAMVVGREPHTHWGFMSSVVRQNVAIIGTALFVGGIVFFFLF